MLANQQRWHIVIIFILDLNPAAFLIFFPHFFLYSSSTNSRQDKMRWQVRADEAADHNRSKSPHGLWRLGVSQSEAVEHLDMFSRLFDFNFFFEILEF